MVVKTLTKDFRLMSLYGKKKVLSKFFGHKVNEIVSGSLVNGTFGEYYVRHETYAYSRLKVETTEDGYMHIAIWNFETSQWEEEAK